MTAGFMIFFFFLFPVITDAAPRITAAAPAAAYGTIGELSPVLTTRISLEDSLFFAALLV